MTVQNHINLLGLKAKDTVTGFHGVITSTSFELYGCIQVILTPPMKSDGGTEPGQWFDVTRVVVTDETPVMARPDFVAGYIAEGRKGGCDKPLTS